MTTAVWDGKTLSADKRSVCNELKHATTTKIFKIDGHLIALAGAFDIGMEMLEWFKSGADYEDYPTQQAKDREVTMMVITPNKQILKYERSPIPLVFEHGQEAIGSGREFALGALACGKTSAEAVGIAAMFDCYTGNGVDTLSLGE